MSDDRDEILGHLIDCQRSLGEVSEECNELWQKLGGCHADRARAIEGEQRWAEEAKRLRELCAAGAEVIANWREEYGMYKAAYEEARRELMDTGPRQIFDCECCGAQARVELTCEKCCQQMGRTAKDEADRAAVEAIARADERAMLFGAMESELRETFASDSEEDAWILERIMWALQRVRERGA